MPTVHEHFSQQFQKWEVRGRGWQVFDQPVYPEPPFTPFAYRSMMETPAVDDGRRHTFLSSLMEKVSQKLTPPAPSRIQPEPEDDPQPVFLNRGSMVELQAALPADFDISRDSFEHLFRKLALCREPVAFELVGSYRRVLVQFAACEDDISLVRRQLQAILPDVQFRQQTGTLKTAWMMLLHKPTELRVKCQTTRQQGMNRFLARRMLLDKIEALQTGRVAAQRDEAEKIRRQKRRRSRRSKQRMLADKSHQATKKENRRRVE